MSFSFQKTFSQKYMKHRNMESITFVERYINLREFLVQHFLLF